MGLQLQEPMSLVFNTLLAIVCLVLFNRIRADKNEPYAYWWKWFFLFMGISAFVGGFAHFLSFYAEYPLKITSWSIIALAMYTAEMGTAELVQNKQLKRFIEILAPIKLVLIVVITTWLFDFTYIKMGTTIGMIGIVLSIHLMNWINTKGTYNNWIIAAVLWMLLPAVVHGFDINLHKWFNKDDFSHVLLIGTFLFFFKGVTSASSESKLTVEPLSHLPTGKQHKSVKN